MRDHNYHVYILTNKHNTVLYTGVTNSIERRMHEHKHRPIEGFSRKYYLTKLAYYEYYENMEEAITREKQIKGWKRLKKIAVVESTNPNRKDLSTDWF